MSTEKSDRLVVSYVLWLLGWTGFAGLHRLYNGKVGTGILWFCTWGLFGVGQFVDVFLVPNMAEEQRLKLMAKAGLLSIGVPNPQSAVAAEVIPALTKEQKMLKLLKAAKENGGHLSVTQGVMLTELGFTEVEQLLNEMYKAGYVTIDNHPTTGAVTYHFFEL